MLERSFRFYRSKSAAKYDKAEVSKQASKQASAASRSLSLSLSVAAAEGRKLDARPARIALFVRLGFRLENGPGRRSQTGTKQQRRLIMFWKNGSRRSRSN